MKRLLCEIGAVCVLGLSFGGQVQALSEQQIKDLVALLLDPESPVNKK